MGNLLVILSPMLFKCWLSDVNLINIEQVREVRSTQLFEFILLNCKILFRGEAPGSGVRGVATPSGGLAINNALEKSH